jgi:ferritin-like metal-binding protein YciE
MTDEKLTRKLVDYIEDNHAMERNVLRMLESLISTTEDDAFRADLQHHHEETKRHAALLEERLDAHGQGTSARKDFQAIGASFLKGLTDMVRGDKAGKNARDAFVTEHMEIAAYELLERLAQRAGDERTAEVARQIRADEEAMAAKIAGTWDAVVDQTLVENDIAVA